MSQKFVSARIIGKIPIREIFKFYLLPRYEKFPEMVKVQKNANKKAPSKAYYIRKVSTKKI